MKIENIANTLSQGNSIKAEEYTYVIKTRMYTIITIAITLTIAYFLGIFQLTAIAGFTISGWRGFSGGAHMESLNSCALVTIIIFNILGLFVNYFHSNINESLLLFYSILILLSGLYVITKKVPIEHKNRPIRDLKFRKQLKYCSYGIFITLMAIFYILYFCDSNVYGVALLSGLSWQLFLMTSLGDKLFVGLDKIIRVWHI